MSASAISPLWAVLGVVAALSATWMVWRLLLPTRLKKLVLLSVSLLRTLAYVSIRRMCCFGPTRKSWSFGFEVLYLTMRRVMIANRFIFDNPVLTKEQKEQVFLDNIDRFRHDVNNPLFPAKPHPDIGFETLYLPTAHADKLGLTPSEHRIESGWFRHANGCGATVLYLHGGGYVLGSVTSHKALIYRVAAACQSDVLAINYGLVPEAPYPQAIHDTVVAFLWLVNSKGCSPEDIVIMGDSAGGNLAITATQYLMGFSHPVPGKVVLLSPWVDLSCSSDSWINNKMDFLSHDLDNVVPSLYANGESLDHPCVSPMNADLNGFPDLLVQAGGIERLEDEIKHFVGKASSDGVNVTYLVYDDMPHVFQMIPNAPFLEQALDDIGDFIMSAKSDGVSYTNIDINNNAY